MRPTSRCLCAELPEVRTRTRLVILQHPRERRHAFGTARLVDLALPDARIEVPRPRNSRALDAPLAVPADAAVLYPHPSAVDLATLPPDERPRVLVILDGTWAHARSLYRHNPWLEQLRHVRLHPSEPSRYRIRREPRPDFVSTVEAIVAALRILEPETEGLDALLAAFDTMIDRQIAHVDVAARHGRQKRTRQRTWRRVPETLDAADLVVAYCETTLPRGGQVHERERVLVRWTAVHVATGAVFDQVVRPVDAMPSVAHLGFMGLTVGDVEAGVPLDTARARFATFAGPSPTVAAWTKTTFEWGAAMLGTGARIVLKSLYANLRNRRPSLLEAVVEREGIDVVPIGCGGRAGARLANALAVARWLRQVRAGHLAATGE